jgi:hypothetical protein
MVRSTPARPAGIEHEFTFVADGMRTTTRLHPRRGRPSHSDSSMGGELKWPAGEPWPHCDLYHDDSAMVPVLQLWARDVPDMPMRPGTDVFQLLWCPDMHDSSREDYGPRIVVVWRDSRLLDPGIYERPQASPELVEDIIGEYLVPRACVLHPERVPEYPAYRHLTEEQRAQVDAWAGQPAYASYSGYAPGTKVGGWPRWFDEMPWPRCPAGHAMEHLLSIASSEFDARSWKAWLPTEDRDSNGEPREDRFDMASGILLGDGNTMIVFVCYRCPDWPTTTRIPE